MKEPTWYSLWEKQGFSEWKCSSTGQSSRSQSKAKSTTWGKKQNDSVRQGKQKRDVWDFQTLCSRVHGWLAIIIEQRLNWSCSSPNVRVFLHHVWAHCVLRKQPKRRKSCAQSVYFCVVVGSRTAKFPSEFWRWGKDESTIRVNRNSAFRDEDRTWNRIRKLLMMIVIQWNEMKKKKRVKVVAVLVVSRMCPLPFILHFSSSCYFSLLCKGISWLPSEKKKIYKSTRNHWRHYEMIAIIHNVLKRGAENSFRECHSRVKLNPSTALRCITFFLSKINKR